MWKKTDNDDSGNPAPSPRPETGTTTKAPSRTRQASGGTATIGQSITLSGDVSGDEDLVIQGRIEGTVSLGTHSVTVGPEGRVKADVAGRVVMVEGQVQGNIRAQEHIALRSSARVEGDLTAPRVSLEDGATFRGRIDMSQQSATVPSTTADGASRRDHSGAARKPSNEKKKGGPDS